ARARDGGVDGIRPAGPRSPRRGPAAVLVAVPLARARRAPGRDPRVLLRRGPFRARRRASASAYALRRSPREPLRLLSAHPPRERSPVPAGGVTGGLRRARGAGRRGLPAVRAIPPRDRTHGSRRNHGRVLGGPPVSPVVLRPLGVRRARRAAPPAVPLPRT